jgi:Flp pilus assembly protein TadD
MAVSKLAASAAQLMKQGLLKEAAREFEAALKQDPTDASALLGLARLRLAQDDEPSARSVLSRLLQLHPTHPEALSHMARLQAKDGNERALGLLRELAAQPKAGFFEVLNHGRALLTAEKHEEATAELERALRMYPGNPQVLTYLGMALQGQKQLDAALKRYQEAAAATRTEHLPLLLASRIQVQQGHIGAALVSLHEAILRAPQEPSLIREFATLSLFAGAPDAAVRAAIELRLKLPESADAVYLHGLAMLMTGKDEDAERILREALERVPNSSDVRLALGKVLRRQGNDTEAQRLLEEAVKLSPDEPGPANDLAVLLMSRPDGKAAARTVLEKALAAQPEDPGLNLNMALALADSDAKRARTHAQKAQASKQADIREQADRLVAALAK